MPFQSTEPLNPPPAPKLPLRIHLPAWLLITLGAGALFTFACLLVYWLAPSRQSTFEQTMRETRHVLDLLGEDAAKSYLERKTK